MQLRDLFPGRITRRVANGRLKQDNRARRPDADVLPHHKDGHQGDEGPNETHCYPRRYGCGDERR